MLVFQLNELDIRKIYINSKHCQEFEEFGLIDLGTKLSYYPILTSVQITQQSDVISL